MYMCVCSDIVWLFNRLFPCSTITICIICNSNTPEKLSKVTEVGLEKHCAALVSYGAVTIFVSFSIAALTQCLSTAHAKSH